MLWLLLFAFVALAIFINSFRLLLLALIALLIPAQFGSLLDAI
jgi:hypothetical protein